MATDTATAPEIDEGSGQYPSGGAAVATPASAATEKQAEAQDAREAAALEAAVALHEHGTPIPRDEQGRFKPRKQDDESAEAPASDTDSGAKEATAEAPQSAPAAKPEDEPADTADDRENFVIARRALKRDGWTDDEIAALKPQDVLDKGARFAERQRKTDERFNALKAGRGDSLERAISDPTNGSAATDGKAESPDFEIPADVLEVLTTDQADALRRTLSEKAKAAETKAAERAQKAEAAARSKLVQAIQVELAAEYPQINASAEPPAVFVRKLSALAATRQYDVNDAEGLRELMFDAAHVAFGKEKQQQTRQARIDSNRAARNGSPDTRGVSVAPKPVKLTDDDRDKIAYEAAMKFPGQEALAREYYNRRVGHG